MSQEQIDILIKKCISGEATLADRRRLIELAGDYSYKAIFENRLDRAWEEVKGQPVFSDVEHERLLEYILAKEPVRAAAAEEEEEEVERELWTTHRIHFLKTAWFRYAAAIICVVGFVSLAYFWTAKNNWQSLADVAPGGEKAVLTLANGKKIILDNAANGTLAQQGNTHIVKLANGQIAYDLKGIPGSDLMMNTMTTPAGGQYQVTLPDGTKAWLNAASSITYPAAFLDKKRVVKISGEVYFEVAKNKEKPFIVDVDGKSLVEVLGTSFNINSYRDEKDIKTTLVEGSLKVVKGEKEAILKPGFQAVVVSSDRQLQNVPDISVESVNIEQTLAWKNGVFDFNDADIHSVMRQLQRWYGIEVKFEQGVPDYMFKGRMYRNVNLSDVLEMFKEMGVKFKMEGKTLIITG